MERVFYEAKPYLCLALSTWAMQLDYVMASDVSGLARGCIFVLVTCSASILYMRAQYRGYIGIQIAIK